MLQQKTKKIKHKYPHIKNEWAKKSLKLTVEPQRERESSNFYVNTSKICILQYFYFLSVFLQSIFI